MKFLLCGALQRTIWDELHYRRAAWLETRKFFSTGITIFLLMASAKIKEDWRMLGRSLLHQGLVEQTSDGYAVLKLNALSWEVMRRQRSVSIAVTAVQTPQQSPGR